MTTAIENVVGGTYSGSGTPNSGDIGSLTTSGPDRLAVIVVISARANTGADFNYPNGITAAGLTFTNKIHQTFSYTDVPGGGSFPFASFSLDVFTAPVATAISGLSWTTSSMTGDGFVNDGLGYAFAISGLDPSAPYDGSGSLPMDATNLSGTPSALALSGFTTDDTNDLLMTIAINHGASGGAPATPSVTSGWTQIAAPFGSSNTGATEFQSLIQTKLQASPGTISITAPYSDGFWLLEGLAFTAGVAPTPKLNAVGLLVH